VSKTNLISVGPLEYFNLVTDTKIELSVATWV